MNLVDFPKEIAGHQLTRASEGRRTMIEEHAASFRWLLASFLTINAGALATIVDSLDGSVGLNISASAFLVGIVMALGVAWESQRSARRGIAIVAESEAFWIAVSHTGQMDEDMWKDLGTRLADPKTGRARFFAWGSLIAFLVGCLSLGLAVQG